jgi:hypothetical protein
LWNYLGETGEGRSFCEGIIFKENTSDAIKRKDLEIWISEALRNAADNFANKITSQRGRLF